MTAGAGRVNAAKRAMRAGSPLYQATDFPAPTAPSAFCRHISQQWQQKRHARLESCRKSTGRHGPLWRRGLVEPRVEANSILILLPKGRLENRCTSIPPPQPPQSSVIIHPLGDELIERHSTFSSALTVLPMLDLTHWNAQVVALPTNVTMDRRFVCLVKPCPNQFGTLQKPSCRGVLLRMQTFHSNLEFLRNWRNTFPRVGVADDVHLCPSCCRSRSRSARALN